MNRLPAVESVVADERSIVTTSNSELNGCVDEVGEVGDAVFEDVVDDLQDTRGVLKERDFRAFVPARCLALHSQLNWMPLTSQERRIAGSPRAYECRSQ